MLDSPENNAHRRWKCDPGRKISDSGLLLSRNSSETNAGWPSRGENRKKFPRVKSFVKFHRLRNFIKLSSSFCIHLDYIATERNQLREGISSDVNRMSSSSLHLFWRDLKPFACYPQIFWIRPPLFWSLEMCTSFPFITSHSIGTLVPHRGYKTASTEKKTPTMNDVMEWLTSSSSFTTLPSL